MPENRTVLVTGAGGFVGRHVLDCLAGRPWTVRCLVRRKSALDELPGLEICRGDLKTGAGLNDAVRGVDTVLHLAGVTKALDNAEYYRGNVQGTQNLLDAIDHVQPAIRRFVHISSLAAIGPSPADAPVAESATPQPVTHYGRSKLKGEDLVRRSPLGTRAVILRPPVVYGPGDTDVFEVLRAAGRGLLVRVGRQEQYVSVVYVKDLAATVVAAAERDVAGKTYFVAGQERVSWTGLASMAAAYMGKRLRTISVPPALASLAGWLSECRSRLTGTPNIISREKIKEARCRYWLCDGARARRELGPQAATPLDQGLAETLSWYKDAGWLRF